MPTLTAAQKEKYLQAPSNCPHCRSDRIEGQSYDYETPQLSQEVVCLICSARWTDIYTLTDVEGIQPPDKTEEAI